MLTGLARRNQSRMCGKLGVEHILVSADIRKKKEHKENVLAWLKKPHLGMIPIFMAGDKQYYYYTNKLMEQYKIGLSIMGENLLKQQISNQVLQALNQPIIKKIHIRLIYQIKLKCFIFMAINI